MTSDAPSPATLPAAPGRATTASAPAATEDRNHGRAAGGSRGLDGISIAWLVLAVLGLVAFAAITVEMLNHVVWPFDQPILATVRPWVGDGTIWRVLSESANIPLIVIGVGMVLVLFFTHRRREAVLVALLLIAVTAGSEGIKQLVARPRPEGTDPNIPGVVYSFPSGHVLEALVIFGVIAIHVLRSHLSRVVAAIAVVAVIADAFLVGLSRVVLNAHWPSDAMASLVAGAGVLGIYGLLTHGDAWATKRSDRHDEPGEHGQHHMDARDDHASAPAG
jgi:undecaprenyl-diphosphatase